jgi:putative FmdB family regulatory protein
VPIYEYECRKCHGLTERIQGLNDPPIRKCPACGGRLEKKMSQGSFILKGSGWYATEYGSKANGVAKNARKEPPCSGAAGGDAPSACSGCPKAQ